MTELFDSLRIKGATAPRSPTLRPPTWPLPPSNKRRWPGLWKAAKIPNSCLPDDADCEVGVLKSPLGQPRSRERRLGPSDGAFDGPCPSPEISSRLGFTESGDSGGGMINTARAQTVLDGAGLNESVPLRPDVVAGPGMAGT